MSHLPCCLTITRIKWFSPRVGGGALKSSTIPCTIATFADGNLTCSILIFIVLCAMPPPSEWIRVRFLSTSANLPPLTENVDEIDILGVQCGHGFRIMTSPRVGEIGFGRLMDLTGHQ